MKKKIIVMVVVILLVFSIAASLYAENQPVNKQKTGSITLLVQCENRPVEGMAFFLYRIGDVLKDGHYIPGGVFADWQIDLDVSNESKRQKGANTLAKKILSENIEPTSMGVTNTKGELFFFDFKTGLYLLIPRSLEVEGRTYQSEPIFISIPNQTSADTLQASADTLGYDMTIYPKILVQ